MWAAAQGLFTSTMDQPRVSALKKLDRCETKWWNNELHIFNCSSAAAFWFVR